MVHIRVIGKLLTQGLETSLLKAVEKQLPTIINKAFLREVEILAREIIVREIKNQPEYPSLLSGDLQAEFGLDDPYEALEKILTGISNRIKASYARKSIVIEFWRDDFEDILGYYGADYISVSKVGTASTVEWLRWLLIGGNRTIITDFNILRGGYFSGTRTGRAVMYHVRNVSGYKVLQQFQGYKGNNFLTRAFDGASPQIIATIADKLAGKFNG